MGRGEEPRLGSKIFYKIGEVSKLTKVPAYVLRFWESQFSFLKPRKSSGNQRLYVQRDIETILEIKRMLYEEGHTLEGVKRYWVRRTRASSRPLPPREIAKKLRGDLQAIVDLIEAHSR
ncbi:MAG: MerR family transcriptional regulator [Nitrospira sp.]|nr:MerR family transcriptional regulator [Nitrospira sp.]MCP9464912.1 MerR family transcriptional regulator [Nitrospira sp.]